MNDKPHPSPAFAHPWFFISAVLAVAPGCYSVEGSALGSRPTGGGAPMGASSPADGGLTTEPDPPRLGDANVPAEKPCEPTRPRWSPPKTVPRGTNTAPTAKQALCQQAWNEIQEMRKASTQDVHPFVAPASYSDDWMRGATDNQTVLLAWPNSFEEFEVETCGAKTSCSVPVAWQLRAATMRVDTSPTLQRYSDVFEPQGKGVRQGHESFGGLTTVYNGPSTVDPYYAHLEWMIFPEPATPSRERALTALGLPTNLPVRSEPLVFEGDVLPHTVAVSFGRTAAFSDRPHWGLAGLTMQAFSRTPPYVQAGFAYFAGPSDGPSPLTTFFERFAPITTNAVHVWDTNTHAFVPCQPNRRLPYAEQCGGVFASEIETLKNATLRSGEKLCATVLWSISGLSNPFASSACILPSGQFAEQGTEGVSMATLGLPSVAAIDALPSLP